MHPPARGPSTDAPQVSRGTKIVTVLVGPEQEEFAIHNTLLCAASRFFERALEGTFIEGQTQEVKLPEEHPEVFAFLVDWLYIGGYDHAYPSVLRSHQQYFKDEYYLNVYRMADRLMIPGLQILAYFRIKDTFAKKAATLPSRGFLHSLFSEEAPSAIQMHVVEHAAYWLLKSSNKEERARLFTSHDRFGTEMALAMIRSQARMLTCSHPEDVVDFIGTYGFNLEELQKQSRASDEEFESKNTKDLGTFFRSSTLLSMIQLTVWLACAVTEPPKTFASFNTVQAGPGPVAPWAFMPTNSPAQSPAPATSTSVFTTARLSMQPGSRGSGRRGAISA